MFRWMRKYRVLLVVVLVLMGVGVPCISLFFNVSVGEALDYYGSFLSFVGTVVLGVLALYQNEVLQRESEKKDQKIREQEMRLSMPRFMMALNNSASRFKNMSWVLTNVSENTARKVRVHDIYIVSGEKKMEMDKNIVSNEFVLLSPTEKVIFNIGNEISMETDDEIHGILSFEDKYGNFHDNEIYGKCANGTINIDILEEKNGN